MILLSPFCFSGDYSVLEKRSNGKMRFSEDSGRTWKILKEKDFYVIEHKPGKPSRFSKNSGVHWELVISSSQDETRINQSKNVTLFPNPSSNKIQFENNLNAIKIFNSRGELTFSSGGAIIALDISEFENGVYFGTGIFKDEQVKFKFIKE